MATAAAAATAPAPAPQRWRHHVGAQRPLWYAVQDLVVVPLAFVLPLATFVVCASYAGFVCVPIPGRGGTAPQRIVALYAEYGGVLMASAAMSVYVPLLATGKALNVLGRRGTQGATMLSIVTAVGAAHQLHRLYRHAQEEAGAARSHFVGVTPQPVGAAIVATVCALLWFWYDWGYGTRGLPATSIREAEGADDQAAAATTASSIGGSGRTSAGAGTKGRKGGRKPVTHAAAAKAAPVVSGRLAVGAVLPNVELRGLDGVSVSVKSVARAAAVTVDKSSADVIVAQPRYVMWVFLSGQWSLLCRAEAADVWRGSALFAAAGCHIVFVTADAPAELKAFAARGPSYNVLRGPDSTPRGTMWTWACDPTLELASSIGIAVPWAANPWRHACACGSSSEAAAAAAAAGGARSDAVGAGSPSSGGGGGGGGGPAQSDGTDGGAAPTPHAAEQAAWSHGVHGMAPTVVLADAYGRILRVHVGSHVRDRADLVDVLNDVRRRGGHPAVTAF